MPAVALDHDRTQGIRAAERVDCPEQALDEVAVVGIVDLGPVENDVRHAAWIDAPKERTSPIRRVHFTSPCNDLSLWDCRICRSWLSCRTFTPVQRVFIEGPEAVSEVHPQLAWAKLPECSTRKKSGRSSARWLLQTSLPKLSIPWSASLPPILKDEKLDALQSSWLPILYPA